MLKARGLERFAQDFRGIVRLGGYNHSIGLATQDGILQRLGKGAGR